MAVSDVVDSKTAEQVAFFSNRLEKRAKHLRKWARRTGVTCYRLYDRDIPEVPLAVDVYEDCLYIALYERPYDKPEEDEVRWLAAMTAAASTVLSVLPERVFMRTRKKQKGSEQYQKNASGYDSEPWKNGVGRIVGHEGGLSFYLNLTDYLDTGLFLDHRPLRTLVREQAAGKRVLNLFCYTGAFSVYAAAGKAARVDSVDLSNTYLAWAQANFALNGLTAGAGSFIRSDVTEFLRTAQGRRDRWDIIVLDPPTFSNSKKTDTELDINRDWSLLVSLCCTLLAPDGVLFFSTNSRRLKFDESLLPTDFAATDITTLTVPEDFRNQNIHRCFKITKAIASN